MKTKYLAVAAVVGLTSLAARADAPRYTLVDVGNLWDYSVAPNGARAWGYSVNNHGDVAGFSFMNAPGEGSVRSFVYKNGQTINIGAPVPDAYGVWAYGINDAGIVTGIWEPTSQPNYRPFTYDTNTNTFTDLGPLNSYTNPNTGAVSNGRMYADGSWPAKSVMDINEAGQIIGSGVVVGPNSPTNPANLNRSRGMIIESGTITTVEPQPEPGTGNNQSYSYAYGINDLGTVVGHATHGGIWIDGDGPYNSQQPYRRYADGTMEFLPMIAGWNAVANAVNNSNLTVGSGVFDPESDTITTAMLWAGTTPQAIPYLPGGWRSAAFDVNDAGQIVGYSTSNRTIPNILALGERAFLYENGELSFLDDLIAPNSEWNLVYAYSINERGDITGVGLYQGETRPFLLLATVPEPMTGMVSFAASGLLIRRKRR